MFWKMSIALTYPLVPSMGHHDPLDGFITYLQLQATGAQKSREIDLSQEITDMATMCEGKSWATEDPLGLGELLSSAYKLAQMNIRKQNGRNNRIVQLNYLDIQAAHSLYLIL